MKNKFVLLEATCIHCHRTFKFSVDATKYEQWRDGKLLIQDAFPELTPGERELLLSSICGECFDIVFGDDEMF